MQSSLGRPIQQIGEAAWRAFQALNTRLPASAPAERAWAPGRCSSPMSARGPPWAIHARPIRCARAASWRPRQILRGERKVKDLVSGHLGEIKATLYEQDNEIRVRKTCPEHGTFEDLISIDAEFSRRIEGRFPGRDFAAVGDELVHRHGTSTIKYGRGRCSPSTSPTAAT
jgi:hypothetical protein